MIKRLCMTTLLLLGVASPAWAEPVHLFDDLNGDGVSDSQQQADIGNTSVPTEESVDVEQPIDEVTEGGTGEQG